MRLVMTLLVRDEESILKENIAYHLSRGIDFIIATDNLSVDSTPDILRGYERKGVLKYLFEPSDDYSQDLWVTRMAQMAATEFKADWIIHADADEFWWIENSKSIKQVLRAVPATLDGLLVSRYNFLPGNEFSDDMPFYEQSVYRDTCSTNPLGNPLPPKVCHRGSAGVHVSQGNHDFSLPRRQARVTESADLSIFHFPYRGYANFRNKIRTGGAAYERNTRLPHDIGRTWRELYSKEQHGVLREYFMGLVDGGGSAEQSSGQGSLVRDTRLARYLNRLKSSGSL